ncbi:hypothetical protein J1N10_18105 [Carboxylicivirga sp. A043]|uniref:hypothetical protein n=1 Tax=Carboxylicivirga litoralis TaxID=2816963 RepID=UPI0021CB0B09|nr:hypothetical protein [Carboxylicivirga sp. A043]MCU4157893.1 hypothetical protein [Carboxylicivirga sp. A043]
MRKISAHYYLKPDGTLGKRPIIELDEVGTIIHIRELGDAFKEEPGLEYFPGILIPGFVASIEKYDLQVKTQAKVNGVLRIKEGEAVLDKWKYRSAWETIQEDLKAGENKVLLTCIMKYTFEAAKILKESKWGVLEEGANPGILILQNIDLRTLSLTDKATFKIIER